MEIPFDKLIELINDGFTITQASKFLKINRTTLYSNITIEQKMILKESKFLNYDYAPTSSRGMGGRSSTKGMREGRGRKS
jgi:hypothetical protein